ncbi:magnesium transporter protection protein MgtU [Enterobacter cloacae complex sp. 2024EL-00215]
MRKRSVESVFIQVIIFAALIILLTVFVR